MDHRGEALGRKLNRWYLKTSAYSLGHPPGSWRSCSQSLLIAWLKTERLPCSHQSRCLAEHSRAQALAFSSLEGSASTAWQSEPDQAIMFMVPALLRLGSNSWALQRGRWKKDPSTGQKEALGCHGCHWSGPCTSKGAVLAKLQAPSLGGMLAMVGHGLQVRSWGTRPCPGAHIAFR